MSYININYPVTDVHDSAHHTLGSRTRKGDDEFIYLAGVADVDSTHRIVVYDEVYASTLIAGNAVGGVAVFAANIVANKYGWAQIFGSCAFGTTDAIATDKAMYIDATAGRVDDATVTGDLVLNMWSRSTDASTNIATLQLIYPSVNDVLG